MSERNMYDTLLSEGKHTVVIVVSPQQSHLLTDWVQKIPEHQPAPVRFRVGHRDKSHVVSDLPLDAEGVSQRKIRPVRLNGPVVLHVAAAATTVAFVAAEPTTAPHRLQNVFINGARHGDGTAAVVAVVVVVVSGAMIVAEMCLCCLERSAVRSRCRCRGSRKEQRNRWIFLRRDS